MTGVYIMIVDDRVFLFTDATVNIEPTAEDLAEIAIRAADYAKQLELEPRIAFLSFSNFGSTPHPLSDKVRKAVELVKKSRPDLMVDGEMQADTAVVPDIIESAIHSVRSRMPTSWSSRRLNLPTSPTNCWPAWAMPRPSARSCSAPAAPIHVLQTGDEVDSIVQVAAWLSWMQ